MEETTIYYQFENGSVAERTVTGSGAVTPPEGATEVTEEEYRTARVAIEEANGQRRQERQAEERAQMKADYDALRALGVPVDTARRLTGFSGPGETDES